MFFLLSTDYKAQLANYVSNGGFEDLIDCNNPFYFKIKSWGNIDTTKPGFQALNVCYGNVPNSGYTYQHPRHGNGFVLGTMLCDVNFCNPNINRNYFKNRLKAKLNTGSTYCVKFYVNNINISAFGIDSYGAYFGNNGLDTINYTLKPLTYLTPQIQNPIGNIIIDTLNWGLITGTFVATGTEKFMVIGNFKSDAATMKTQIQPTVSYAWCDANIDDVSVIDIDLPAYAGADVWGIPTNTVYLGRPQDVGIDEACMWYKLPNTTTAIDTAAGITVTVATTTQTYMVKQDICGNIKYDTVVVHASGLGLTPLSLGEGLGVRLYPNPANEILNVEFVTSSSEAYRDAHIQIINSLGQVIREEEIVFKDVTLSGVKVKTVLINTMELANGVYFLKLSSRGTRDLNTDPSYRQDDNMLNVSKRFFISR
ncbi:MAG: T9SS type A sorting domain-containing protein [Bacteroidota bacterium]|nr:T9SS type A sorting domain-containing protein [Bacteroidota bacterium]MDP3144899.1 T9SS type A sorting domain-containing protein [Bacteroidota bacterium]